MSDHLSIILFALADPTRRGILARLVRGDATVTELAKPYAMSLAAVSKHLKVLEGAGLISRGKDAQWRPCHLETAPLVSVSKWLDDYRRFWATPKKHAGAISKLRPGRVVTRTTARKKRPR